MNATCLNPKVYSLPLTINDFVTCWMKLTKEKITGLNTRHHFTTAKLCPSSLSMLWNQFTVDINELLLQGQQGILNFCIEGTKEIIIFFQITIRTEVNDLETKETTLKYLVTQGVTFMVVFAFLHQIFGRWQEPMNSTLSFFECRFTGGNTQTLPTVIELFALTGGGDTETSFWSCLCPSHWPGSNEPLPIIYFSMMKTVSGQNHRKSLQVFWPTFC